MPTNDEQEKDALLERVKARRESEKTPWEQRLVFLGFATQGSLIAAELTRDGQVLRIAINLGPGQEPTEDILLAAIAEGVEKLDNTRLGFKDFEDKYRNKVIDLPEVETAA